MYSIKGSYKNGVVTPEKSVPEREGQNVLITFLDNGTTQDALHDDRPTIEELVARLKVSGPEPSAYTPPFGSLATALVNAPYEIPIDSVGWDRRWAIIEAEMKARDLADERMEGRS